MRIPSQNLRMTLLILIFALTTTACTERNPNLDTSQNSDADTIQTSDTFSIDADQESDSSTGSDTPEAPDKDTDTPDTSINPNTNCTISTDCAAREYCNDDKICTKATTCQQLKCADTERCLPINLTCIHDCISDATLCTDGQACNPETAKCQNAGCINPSAAPGSCNGATPHYDPETCSCLACTKNDDCHNDETCSADNICVRANCETTCDPTVPGTCAGQTPYCANGCCSECIGSADCPDLNACVDGTCTPLPTCDPAVPGTCPTGHFCDQTSRVCTPTGDDGCGLCNPDCSCPNNLICDGFMCTGCQITLPGQPSQCPAGQSCILGLNACLPI